MSSASAPQQDLRRAWIGRRQSGPLHDHAAVPVQNRRLERRAADVDRQGVRAATAGPSLACASRAVLRCATAARLCHCASRGAAARSAKMMQRSVHGVKVRCRQLRIALAAAAPARRAWLRRLPGKRLRGCFRAPGRSRLCGARAWRRSRHRPSASAPSELPYRGTARRYDLRGRGPGK